VTGTLINVATVLLGTLAGTLVGSRLPQRLQDRVLAGLGLVTLVIGVELALTWRDTNTLFVLGGVLLGGIAGEALRIEDRLERSATGCRPPPRAATRRARARSPGVLHRHAAVLRRAADRRRRDPGRAHRRLRGAGDQGGARRLREHRDRRLARPGCRVRRASASSSSRAASR
jgi:hypothetical protein